MSEHLLRMVGLDPAKVRAMMTPVEAPKPNQGGRPRMTASRRTINAYDMIGKTGCTLESAARSYAIPVCRIVNYAKRNNLPYHWQQDGMVKSAKELVSRGIHTNVRHGLKARVAYELALKHGVSKACRMVGTSREGFYAYCRRYELPTPVRVTGAVSG
jgi:hypothetical protein